MKAKLRKAILVMATVGVGLTSNAVYEYQSQLNASRSIATADDITIELVDEEKKNSKIIESVVKQEDKVSDEISIELVDEKKKDVANADEIEQGDDQIANQEEEDSSELSDLKAKLCEQTNKIEDLEAKIEGLLVDKEEVLTKFEKRDNIMADMSTLMLYHHLFISSQHRAMVQPFNYTHNPLSNFNLMSSLLLPYYFQNLAAPAQASLPAIQGQEAISRENVIRTPSSKTLGEGSFQDSLFNRYTRIVPSFNRGQAEESFIQL